MPVLRGQLLQAPVIFTDDTTLALRAPRGQRCGKTITARIWTYISGGAHRDEQGRWKNVAPVALYDFTLNRAGEHPRRILEEWSGWPALLDHERQGLAHAWPAWGRLRCDRKVSLLAVALQRIAAAGGLSDTIDPA
ncbi:MAG TPA: transposase [Burkholderiaceae bacterium]|nr:transposase [Burkholderiaceae bacterium]